MQEHFNFTDEQFKKLLGDGVTVTHLFKFARDWDFSGKELPVTDLHLLYYIDEKGDFNQPPHLPSKKIARAIFNKLTTKEQMYILQYIEWSEEEDE